MKSLLIIIFLIVILAISACIKNNEEKPPSGTIVTETVTTTGTVTVTAPAETTTLQTTASETPPVTDHSNEIVMTAEGLIGIEFAVNGDSPAEGFDNSGFIYYVLRENGYISCPRNISEQLEWGENTDYEGIKAGDVVYFSDEPGGDASFGGIYAGNGIMIYSPYPGETVKTADITAEYWKSRFVTALSL